MICLAALFWQIRAALTGETGQAKATNQSAAHAAFRPPAASLDQLGTNKEHQQKMG
jgi:hypothetical protein